MSTLVIKNLPDDLRARLKDQAERNRRSVNKEAIQLLASGLLASRPAPRPLPDPVRLKSGRMLSIEDIEAAIAEGRE